MPDCPSDDDLAGFLNESIPPEEAAGLSGHVDGCPGCQSRLDKLTNDTGGPVARYQDVSSVVRIGPEGSGVAASPEVRTRVTGVNPVRTPPRLTGLPHVPGFDVVREIGRGGMGVVYKARHRRLNRLVALKMIIAGGAADAQTVQRFLFEAEVMARVQHPQVVQVFEVDTYSGAGGVPIPYLAMELVEGGSLARKLREARFTPRQSAELLEGIARAVHAAHLQGVVHRDLKPGNILFSAEFGPRNTEPRADKKAEPAAASDPPLPKVTDFGLAKFTESGAELTAAGQVVGTPHYMAPEQAAGGKAVGPPADVYAMGAILFECLTRRLPFEGTEPLSVMLKVVNEPPPDVRSLCPEVPAALSAIVARCLDKDPARRYPTAADFADDLRRFLSNRPTVARPLRRRDRLRLWVRRNPAVAGLVAALVAVAVLAFALVTRFWLQAERKAADEYAARVAAGSAEADARRQRDLAIEKTREATDQKENASRREAELGLFHAAMQCEEGRVREGLRGFARAVELAEALGDRELARVARVNLAAWPCELPRAARAFPHVNQPRYVAFHPDGRHMVTVGRHQEAYLWEVDSGRMVQKYEPAPAAGGLPVTGFRTPDYWTAAVSPDGNIVAAGGGDGRITVWKTGETKPALAFKAVAPDDDVWSLAFAPDGTLWASDGQSGVSRWDLTRTKSPLQRLTPPPGARAEIVNVIALSPDGKRVYAGDRGGTLRGWDAETGKAVWEHDTRWWVQDLAVSPDGTRVAATGPEGKARVLDPTGTRDPVTVDLAGGYGNGVAFAPKRPYLATADQDGNVRFWHRDTGHPIGMPLRLPGLVTRIRFRPHSDEFVAPAGKAVHLCGLPDPSGDLLSVGHRHRVRGLDFSPAGDRFVVADEHAVEVFDLKGHRSVQRIDYKKMERPLAVRFDPDPLGNRLFFAHRHGLDWAVVPEGVTTHPVPGGLFHTNGFDILPGRKGLVAMGSVVVSRIDPVTLEQVAVESPAAGIGGGVELTALAVRPDGGEVLVAIGRRVVFLDPETLKPVREWPARGDEVLDARYAPDGTKVLIGRRDCVAELLDAATGDATSARPMPHARGVVAVAVAADGQLLLTGSRDGTARFWDAKTGLPLGAPMRHTGPVTRVAVAPNGEHATTGTEQGHVMLWDLPPRPATGTVDELRAAIDRLGN